MRRPRGYVGTNHETIGTDILSVQRSLNAPEQVLPGATMEWLAGIKPDGWYPIQNLLEMMNELDTSIGVYGLRKMGRTLFRMSHMERVKQVAHSARDIIYSLDDMYHHANRGQDIGGWKVISFVPGKAEVDKNTPHHCAMEEGILAEALEAVGVPAIVTQSQCFRSGADSCVFEVSSAIRDQRWTG